MSPAERWRATVAAVAEVSPAAAAAPGQLRLRLGRLASPPGRPPHPALAIASEYPSRSWRSDGPSGRGPRFDRAYEQRLLRRGEVPPLASGFADYRADLALARAHLREQLAYIAAHALDSWTDQ